MLAGDSASVNELKMYVMGLGDGMLFLNTQAKANKAPLYCQPPKLALALENYLDIINQQLSGLPEVEQSRLDVIPLGAVLLRGLQVTFPCK